MSPATAPGRLGVGVVGAGRVGAPLASALRAVGHAVVGASGASPASLDRIDSLLPGVPVLDVPEVVRRAELVLLTVPDDELPGVVSGLAATGAWQAGQLVVHTAGRYGWRVLEPARAAGAIPLAIHPAMTFTGTSLDVQRLVGAVFAVTAPTPVLPIGQALVVEVGGEPVVVEESARGLYHAALAHGANHLVVLVAQAAQALAAAGIERPGRTLEYLLTAALDEALRAEQLDPPRDGAAGPGAVAALTGPVVRGDVGTVREHLDVLGSLEVASADIAPSYRVLARSAASRALAAGRIGPDAAAALLDALDTGPLPAAPPGPPPRLPGSRALPDPPPAPPDSPAPRPDSLPAPPEGQE